jgi:hypothetical protein
MKTASDKKPLCVVCADIGSVKSGTFGWAALIVGTDRKSDRLDDHGTLPSKLGSYAAEQLATGTSVAPGFECPLWIPLAASEEDLTSGRPDEGNRPWSASGGATVLASSLPIITWTLREIARGLAATGRSARDVPLSLDFETFSNDPQGLLVWEAFVSGDDKLTSTRVPKDVGDHIRDAAIGAETFIARWRKPGPRSKGPRKGDETISLIGMALIRSGWTDIPAMLTKPVEIVRPEER